MLLFARCNGDLTAQCEDQQHKYAYVKYIEYTKDGMYVADSEHILISEADNIVPCNDQTLSLSLSTESVNLRPQKN